MKTMYRIPAARKTRPMGAIWNMPIGPAPSFSLRPLTTMLVLVPISVTVPPKLVPKLSGISNLPGCMFALWAICTAMGMKTATMGVLFTKALMAPIRHMNANRPQVSLRRKRSLMRGPTVLNAPVRMSAALMANMKATVIVALSLNPATASLGEITPESVRAAAIMSATRSMLSFSLMNSASATTTTPATIHWSGVIIRSRRRQLTGAAT